MSVKNIRILAVLLLFMPLLCCGKDFSPEFVRHVFLNLDVTSFPNSFGPLHLQKGTTVREVIKIIDDEYGYEIKPCKEHKSCILLLLPYHIKDSPYIDDGKTVSLTIIEKRDNKIMTCFTDFDGWGTSKIRQPLELKKVKGKYLVTKAYNTSIDGCKYYIHGG